MNHILKLFLQFLCQIFIVNLQSALILFCCDLHGNCLKWKKWLKLNFFMWIFVILLLISRIKYCLFKIVSVLFFEWVNYSFSDSNCNNYPFSTYPKYVCLPYLCKIGHFREKFENKKFQNILNSLELQWIMSAWCHYFIMKLFHCPFSHLPRISKQINIEPILCHTPLSSNTKQILSIMLWCSTIVKC